MPLLPFLPAPMPVTDGVSIAAWQTDTAVRVVDDATPLTQALVLRPSPCWLRAVTATDLGLDCNNGTLQRRSIADDRQTDPPGTAAIAADLQRTVLRGSNSDTYTITGLGSRALSVRIGGLKGGPAHVRFDLQTGARLGPVFLGPSRVVSLDQPGGTTRLCSPLRVSRRAQRNPDDPRDPPLVVDQHAYRPPRLLINHGVEVRLLTCGRAGYEVLGRSAFGQTPILTRRYAAWTDGRRVYVHGFRSRRTRTVQVRRPADLTPMSPVLAATDRRLWIQDAVGVRVLDL